MSDHLMTIVQRYADAMVEAATLRQELQRMGALGCPVADAIMPEVRERAFSDDVCPCDRIGVAPVVDAPESVPTPSHLTITLTGPQGCGKTAMADWLRIAIDHLQGKHLATSTIVSARDWVQLAIKDRPVTIIDTAKDT